MINNRKNEIENENKNENENTWKRVCFCCWIEFLSLIKIKTNQNDSKMSERKEGRRGLWGINLGQKRV